MPILGRTDSRLRMVAILLVFAVIGTAASLRLGYWQVVAADGLTAQIDRTRAWNEATSQQIVRADIVDRNDKVIATSSSFDKLVAHPNTMDPEDLDGSVELLAVLLGLSSSERLDYLETLGDAIREEDYYLVLESELQTKQGDKVRAAIEGKLLPGYALQPASVRKYPRVSGEPGGTLASNVLGYVRADSKGGDGIELKYEERLTTIDPGLVDLATVGGTSLSSQGQEPEPLQLTIDARLQRAVERELHSARVATKAKSVSAVVMHPETGAILAAASLPGYDAEDFAAIANTDPNLLKNRLFADQYEPGSVMKIFTATAALDLGLVTPNTIVRDEKVLEFWKYKVRNADHQSKGNLKVKDVIALSRNVATAKLARMLAPNSTEKAAHRLYDLWEKVGMAGKTGADVASEATGTWYDPDEKGWAPVDLANRAFGQGVAVTLPQLARGVATIVNGGFVVQPHFVVDGEAAQVEPERVLRAKTARQARDILKHVTGSVPWYAAGSLIPGYEIGGKTGTAQIWNSRKGQWKKRRFNHSFIGFVGGRKQEYVIAVRLEEPVPMKVEQGNLPLRIESYELFQMVARTTINQLKMKKSKDPNAGRPIIGTAAAKALDPVRNRQAIQAAKATRKSESKQPQAEQVAKKQTAKSKQSDKRKSERADLDVAAEPPADADEGT